ncbi:hypothetical protein HYFRA_00006812 [Hymenoscyphus fraxineus]|uniref:AB hydrolase-1 domain-containing protein n=1 Tax=Hymenoscyphus fraxineus TaxID=746836 RepID=A0A9N9KN11_9HELO|nr:hypothetical protein HYFRA_00006812 [Hymenoscyphus fraxineus]
MFKPTFICVHGAWHTSSCWDEVKSLLEAQGYECICPDLPTTNSNPPKDDFTEDVEMIRSTVEKLVNDGKHVILVTHSYSGVPGGQALKGLDKPSCEKRGIKGGVIRLVYIASFMVPEGFQNSTKGTRDGMAESMKTDFQAGIITVGPEDAKALFYQDIPDETVAELSKDLKPQSIGCWWSTTNFAAWRYIPTTYVVCTKDAPTTVAAAEFLVRSAQESENKVDTVIRREVGHSPFFSQPEWTAGMLRQAAGENLEGI